ncbi:MAG TPA: hypothetical protein PKE45_21530 [Caldilineaceae bacterium]|nr:hypothetical protein [Caldilineaceae bacterium]
MLDLNNIYIGKIVKSNTHIDYICQIYNPGETDLPPQPIDYTFGTFVGIELDKVSTNGSPAPAVAVDKLIGVIYNTLLLNPDFGNLGPRLSPRQELEIFSPDYFSETATLVGIITLGWRDSDGFYHQGVPALAATVNNFVHRLDDQDLLAFHSDAAHGPRLRYAPILLGQNNPLVPPLLIAVIDQLNDLFPAHRRQLAVMRNNLAWKSIVQPAG